MIKISDLRTHVIEPCLARLAAVEGFAAIDSPAAVDLLVGTALAESVVDGDMCLVQLGDGPARGIFQMEFATHADCWVNFLDYPANTALGAAVNDIRIAADENCLVSDLDYAAAMARVKYWRDPQALPAFGDVEGYAAYWKRVYNTGRGAGKAAEFVRRYERWG